MELYLMLHFRMFFSYFIIVNYSTCKKKKKNLKITKTFSLFESKPGFSTVWASLENGAKLIGKSVSSETVMTVKYK